MTTRIYLEDQGQDFLSFTLTDENRIADANLQGWVWNGRKITNTPLHAGDKIQLEGGDIIRHPIETVEIVREFDK